MSKPSPPPPENARDATGSSPAMYADDVILLQGVYGSEIQSVTGNVKNLSLAFGPIGLRT